MAETKPETKQSSEYIKNFNEWFDSKKEIHTNKIRPDFAIGEVWYCSFGENIGFEIDGKNKENTIQKLFLRPVLVIQATSKYTFVGLPLTSKIEKYVGKVYAFITTIKDVPNAVLLGQVKTFDAKRLQFRMTKISDKKIQTIKEKFVDYILGSNQKNNS